MKFFRNKNNGFTLIELLVVVAIIGLLSSIVFASLNSARAKARDAKRASDVHELKTALDMYFNDYGSYPLVATPPGVPTDNIGTLMPPLTVPLSPYIKQIPDDPLGDSNAWQYVRGPENNNSYGLWVYTEKLNNYCVSVVGYNPGWWGTGEDGSVGPKCPF